MHTMQDRLLCIAAPIESMDRFRKPTKSFRVADRTVPDRRDRTHIPTQSRQASTPRACSVERLRPRKSGQQLWESSGDTIPERLGEFREIRECNERIGIAAYGHPPGRPGTTGVERLRPREYGLRSDGGERGKTDGFFRRDRPIWCHTKINNGPTQG